MRRRITVLATVVLVFAAATAAGAAYAAATHIQEPSATGVISSCYNTGTGKIRMVKAAARCAAGEHKLTWQQNVRRPIVHVVGGPGEPAYESGWKAYNGYPFGNLSFFKDASGVVHLTGLACEESGADPSLCRSAHLIGSFTHPIFTLPAGFRPAGQQLFTVMSAAQGKYYQARVDVTTDGVVEIVTPPDAGKEWMSFDGLTFLAR